VLAFASRREFYDGLEAHPYDFDAGAIRCRTVMRPAAHQTASADIPKILNGIDIIAGWLRC